MESITEMLDKLTEVEREHWSKFLNSKFFLETLRTQRLKETALLAPPMYLYKLRSTGHLATIKEYVESIENEDAPIMVTVFLHPEWNPSLLAIREIFGVPVHDLERIGIVEVEKRKKRLSMAKSLPFMQRVINTRNREDVRRGNKQ